MDNIIRFWVFNIYQPLLDKFCYGVRIRTYIRWKIKGII